MKNNKAITMVSLIITIIVMIILIFSVSSLIYGVIEKTEQAKFISQLSNLDESFKLYIMHSQKETNEFNLQLLSWDGKEKVTNSAGAQNGKEEDSIKDILGDIPKKFVGKISIKNGKIIFHEFEGKEKEIIESKDYKVVSYSVGNSNKIEFKEGKTKIEDLTITVGDNNTIRFDGKITSFKKYFINLSDKSLEHKELNGSAYDIFDKWMQKADIFAEKGETLVETVDILSGSINVKNSNAQCNMVIRGSNNEALLNCKIIDGINNVELQIDHDAVLPYLYVYGPMEFDNYEIKVNIQNKEDMDEEPIIPNEGILNLRPSIATVGNLTARINSDGTIALNGKAPDQTYLRLTDGFAAVEGTLPANNTWIKTGTVIAKTGENINMTLEKISGNYDYENSSSEFNCVVRDISNTAVLNLKTRNMTFENGKATVTLNNVKNNINVLYLYLKGTTFNNFVFRPIIEKVQ